MSDDEAFHEIANGYHIEIVMRLNSLTEPRKRMIKEIAERVFNKRLAIQAIFDVTTLADLGDTPAGARYLFNFKEKT